MTPHTDSPVLGLYELTGPRLLTFDDALGEIGAQAAAAGAWR